MKKIILSLFSLFFCHLALASVTLENGDLLFVTASQQGLSGAIDSATNTGAALSFDHVGLLEKDASGVSVLHADTDGSQQQSLAAFKQHQQHNNKQIWVYRLKAPYQPFIPAAIAKAKTMLGRPYNFTYIPNEQSFYCSDFIERAFRSHHVFALQPMNFKDKKTGQISDYWIELYKKQGLEVPQGVPGTNPNDMSNAPVLVKVGEL